MDKKYKRMLKVMAEKERTAKKKKGRRRQAQKPWFLYVLRCKDKTLYTGVTNNLERRVKMHSDGKASRYTRTRRPLALVYQETCGSRTQALVRECQIKAFSKKKKEKLIC